MVGNLVSVYQSGQTVPITGTYELVGAARTGTASDKGGSIRALKAGDIFPSLDGWEVCWHLQNKEGGQNAPKSIHQSQ